MMSNETMILRIRHEKAARESSHAEAEFRKRADAAGTAWAAYRDAAKADGWCPFCDPALRLEDCAGHAFIAERNCAVGLNPPVGPVQPVACRAGQMLYALTDEQAGILNARLSELAWSKRDLSLCRCDHCQSCQHCYPAEFRPGGLWKPNAQVNARAGFMARRVEPLVSTEDSNGAP